MVVTCPKCKTRLKVDEARLLPQGSRFKCPKCSTALIVKKPAASPARKLDNNTILVAHSNPAILEKTSALLSGQGYKVVASADGIDAMVKALKEFPFLMVVEVVLPKIYGFEVCKRLKARPETKDMKFLLITSPYDKTKYRREPASLYGADEYIEDHSIPSELITKINALRGVADEPEKPIQPPAGKPEPAPALKTELPEKKVEQPFMAATPPPTAESAPSDEKVEKAKRLSRTIINDIYLYNSARVDESIKNNTFYSVFSSEIKEGKKLYENRIAPDVRQKGDFYHEAIENFISSRKNKIS